MKNNMDFNEYVEKFKELPLENKKEITIDEMKEVIALLTKLNSDLNIDSKILLNEEILEVSNNKEDDYVEAIFVYINAIKEAIGTYVDKVTDLLYENKQE